MVKKLVKKVVKNSGEEKVFVVVECHNNICYNSKRILEKGVLVLNYYLVDYENVNKTGLNGVAKLDKDDVVCIFYSENADSLTFGLHRRLNESAAEIIYKKVVIGNKNALDFQLSSYLGYIIHEHESEGKQYDYYIVSKDKAFENLIKFWGTKATIKLVVNVARESEQSIQDELELEVFKLIKNKDEAIIVAKIIQKYKTKSGINNALMKELPSKNHQKASQIYSLIKPLIADKKGK